MSSIEKIRLGVLKIRQDLIFPADDGEIDPIDELGDNELASAHYWQAEAYLRLAEESLKLAIHSASGGGRCTRATRIVEGRTPRVHLPHLPRHRASHGQTVGKFLGLQFRKFLAKILGPFRARNAGRKHE